MLHMHKKMITHILTLSELAAPVSLCIKATNIREKINELRAHFGCTSVHVLHYTKTENPSLHIIPCHSYIGAHKILPVDYHCAVRWTSLRE